MKLRLLTSAAAAVVVLVSASATAGAARPTEATPSSTAGDTARLRALALAQTASLLAHYRGGSQSAFPQACGQDQSPAGVSGVFLLPVLSFTPTSRAFACRTTARAVLLDVGGAVNIEDSHFPSSYWLTSDGFHVPYSPDNLVPICNDVIARGFLTQAPATVDGVEVPAQTPFTTDVLDATIKKVVTTSPVGPLYSDSVDLGHPGHLAAAFCGRKVIVRLAPGRHTLTVRYGALFSPPNDATFSYFVTVAD